MNNPTVKKADKQLAHELDKLTDKIKSKIQLKNVTRNKNRVAFFDSLNYSLTLTTILWLIHSN
ncbi:hypothetical protein NBRC111452_634 [Companilactobacillus farciminis]|nr:hypothetical protein NBRC111452_634 [Companilactobacillus farciminis]